MKASCLLIGLGIGLLAGFFLDFCFLDFTISEDWKVTKWVSEMRGIIYGASILLFGGFGLLIAFILEMKLLKKKEVEK